MHEHEQYMERCIALAMNGAGYTAPNPMVGAVLVHENRIIGEGYHQQFGEAHAEVNCIASVQEKDQGLISSSVMYVSLEPCAHFGKTPPCADLIIRHKIPRVVIGCRDPFPQVNGRGIEKLLAAGIELIVGVLEQQCRHLNKRFFTFHQHHRPYIILKWAQTADRKIGGPSQRLFITDSTVNRLVHRWRSEEAAIMVGTRTAIADDPLLTNRLWMGPSPVRVVIDKELRLPHSLRVFSDDTPTIIINTIQHGREGNVLYYQVTNDVSLVHQVLNALYNEKILSVMVEGGARLLQSFIDEEIWDEARVITNKSLQIGEGVGSPDMGEVSESSSDEYGAQTIRYYYR